MNILTITYEDNTPDEHIFSYMGNKLYHIDKGYNVISAPKDIYNMFLLIVYSMWPSLLNKNEYTDLQLKYEIDGKLLLQPDIQPSVMKDIMTQLVNYNKSLLDDEQLNMSALTNKLIYFISKPYIFSELLEIEGTNSFPVRLFSFKWVEHDLELIINTNSCVLQYKESDKDEHIIITFDNISILLDSITISAKDINNVFSDTAGEVITQLLSTTTNDYKIEYNNPANVDDINKFYKQLSDRDINNMKIITAFHNKIIKI